MRVRKTSHILSSADIYRAFSCVSLKLERTVMLLISSTIKIPPRLSFLINYNTTSLSPAVHLSDQDKQIRRQKT